MKLFFDARFIRTDHHDGVSRYSAFLLAAVAKIHPVTAIISDKAQVDAIPHDIEFVFASKPTSWREPFIARTLNRYQPDVVFSPLQTMGSIGRNYHLILTQHDLIYYNFNTPPTHLAPHIKLAWWLFHQAYWPARLMLNRADAVATVSHTSKALIKNKRLTRRPLRVVANAPLPRGDKKPAAPKTPTKNLIFMGSFMPYKNVETLIGALFFLPEYQLHCLTRISDSRQRELLNLAPPNQLVFHNGVSDEEYEQLLSSAHALVTASKSEGFGLPVIEAMQLGVPVICSDIPIFHEVAGESALFFAPDNQTEFAKQVVKLENPKVRSVLVKRGREQAKKFNWDHSAQALLTLARDISE